MNHCNYLKKFIPFPELGKYLELKCIIVKLYSEKCLNERQKELMSRGLPKKTPLKGVKQIIMVASGKGGVGKSTVAVNLAVTLKMLNPRKEIGLLDADVFGPSIPLMMNLHETPLLTDDNLMKPLVNYGVKCMSIGNLVTDKSALIWRGLMVMNALEKLLRHVDWNPLDCLIVDTPPGTGDTHLSLIQNVPIAGSLIVTTSQIAALQVAKRGIVMFQKLNIPVLGLVHNMSSVICSHCHKSTSLFGNHIDRFAKENDVNILQSIPIDEAIAEGCDLGKPAILSFPDSVQAAAFKDLAKQVSVYLETKCS